MLEEYSGSKYINRVKTDGIKEHLLSLATADKSKVTRRISNDSTTEESTQKTQATKVIEKNTNRTKIEKLKPIKNSVKPKSIETKVVKSNITDDDE